MITDVRPIHANSVRRSNLALALILLLVSQSLDAADPRMTGDAPADAWIAVRNAHFQSLGGRVERFFVPDSRQTIILECNYDFRGSDEDLLRWGDWSDVEAFKVSDNRLTSRCLQIVQRSESLHAVEFDSVKVRSMDLQILVEMQRRFSIRLRDCQLDRDDIEILSRLHSISELMLDDNPLADGDLDCLHNLVDLEWFSANGTRLTDEGLRCLSRAPKLQIASFNRTLVSGAFLRTSDCPSLKNLSLNSFRRELDLPAINAFLARHPLDTLSLRDQPIHASTLIDSLNRLDRVEELDVQQTFVTELDTDQIKDKFPRLRLLITALR